MDEIKPEKGPGGQAMTLLLFQPRTEWASPSPLLPSHSPYHRRGAYRAGEESPVPAVGGEDELLCLCF